MESLHAHIGTQDDLFELRKVMAIKENDNLIFQTLVDHQEMIDYLTVKSIQHDLLLKRT